MLRLKETKRRGAALLARLVALGVGWGLVFIGPSAWALGTPAGTLITSTATVSYTLGSDPAPQTATASESFQVLEVIDTVLTWQDAAPVQVNTPQSGRALAFLLANTGNGPEAFTLSVDDTLGGDDFDPAIQSVWLETNMDPGLQTTGVSPDTVMPGATPEIPADGSLVVYLLAEIPSGLTDAAVGQVRLRCAATTAGAAGAQPGTELAGAGPGGTSAIVGTTEADSEATGTFEVAAVTVQIIKSVAALQDPTGGGQPCPGARVTYRLAVAVGGSGTARGLRIVDVIPNGLTYVTDSITLDGTPQTDAADAPVDTSDFNVSSPDTVTVELGDTVAPATHLIEFATTIN